MLYARLKSPRLTGLVRQKHRRPGPADLQCWCPGGAAGGVRPAAADGGADPGPGAGNMPMALLHPWRRRPGLCPAADLRQGFVAVAGEGAPWPRICGGPGAQPQRGPPPSAAPGLPGPPWRRRYPPPASGCRRPLTGPVSRQSGAESHRRGHLSPAPAAHHRLQRRSGGAAGSPAAGAGHLRALWQDPPGRDGAQHRHQDPAHRQYRSRTCPPIPSRPTPAILPLPGPGAHHPGL